MRVVFTFGLSSLAFFLTVSCVKRKFNADNSSSVQDISSYGCPSGFVPVPGNATPGLGGVQNQYGVASFCIAQFEMKKPTDPMGSNREMRDYELVPVSKPEFRPWTRISRDEAAEACTRMSASGYSFGLITNGEWQTVARNIEATNSNWSGGSVGQGSIPMGHSDFSPNHALPATDSSTGYTDTLNNAANGWKQRRTHWLSNGEIVWDLSGNVWEWVYEDKETLGIDHSNFERQEMPTLKSRNRLLFGPVNSFGKAQNMGLLWPGPNEAVGRGSSWGFDTSSGIFGASVGNNFPNSENISTGFRCVARPQSETTPRVVTNPRAATTPRTATTPRAATTPQEVDSLNFKCESFLDNQKFQYVLTDKNRLIVKDKSGKTVADVVAVDKKGASMTLAGEAIKVYFDAQSSSGNRLFIYRKSDSYRLILSHESVASAIPMRCRPDAINE